jgi:hypothetical protein
MAVHKGSEGYVKVGANTVAEVRDWSISESADTIETSSMGDSARTYVAGLTSATGSIAVHYDDTDTTGQGAMSVGSSISLELYVDADTYASMTAIITEAGVSSSFDGIVEGSFSFTVDGAVTWN